MRKLLAFLCVLCASALLTNELTAAADPMTLPLLQFADLQYLGGFRLPRDISSGSFSYGGLGVAYNPGRNSLFISNRKEMVTEVTIPAPVNSANPEAMNWATYLQHFADPTEGNLWQVAPSDVSIQQMLVYNNRLYGTASIYYDGSGVQRVSHYSRSTNLSEPSFVGMTSIGDPTHTGFVDGYMAVVPPEWRTLLGGPAVTGQCCLPVAARTSWGPSAFAFDPAQIGYSNPVPDATLLYYDDMHPTLGPWMGSNPTWGANVQINNVILIAGTRTALYIGRNAMGPFCYGEGTGVQSLVGTMSPNGAVYCYDPTNPAKGQHGYPYRYQMWAYDLAELAKVKAGQKNPWDVVPYGVWPFEFPTPESRYRIGGVGYDAARQLIYVSQMLADTDGYANRPIIQVLKVNAPTSTPVTTNDPLPPPPDTPIPGVTVSAVTLVADKPSPQSSGTSITFTAAPTGGVGPLQFKWFVNDGSKWTIASDWSTSQKFTWIPSVGNSAYRIGVWAKSYNNPADYFESTTNVEFPISGGTVSVPPPTSTTSSGPVQSVTLVANRVAPQAAGTSITWTAAASGGAGPQQYKWFVFNGSWSAVTGWSTLTSFTWTPAAANANYRVGVWARSATSTADALEASAEQPFAITAGSTTTSPTPTTTTSSTVQSVLLTSDKPAPQPRGTTITFTAKPSGGVAPHQYMWFVNNGYGWSAKTGWTTSNTYAWSPGDSNAYYRVGVWVKSANNTGATQEASAEMNFPTIEPTYAMPSPTNTGTNTSKVTSMTLTPDKTGTSVGVSVTFTAVPTGGVSPYQYKWFIYNGSGWTAVTGWITSNAYLWTPTSPNANYRVGVWVRSATSTADTFEVSKEYAYPVK